LTASASTQPAGFAARSREQAESAAYKLVLDELAITRNRNPADQPMKLVVSESAELSWAEGLRHWGTGKGFTFFPDESN
jgi:hypothetical protein